MHGTNLIMLNLSLLIRLWRDFFTWRPDAFQATGRARFLPLRVMPDVGIHPSGGTPDEHRNTDDRKLKDISGHYIINCLFKRSIVVYHPGMDL